MNIVQIILKLLGSGDVTQKIASLLGINPDQAGKAVGAAIPAILAGLAGTASKPEGAAKLASALGKQDAGLLDNLGSLFSGGGDAAASQGSDLLGSLLGGGGMGAIGSVLSRFTGVGEGGTGKLMGLLTPVVLGAIGKQSKGMDAAGLANMLAGQKGNITSALPAGLGSLLSSAVPGLGEILGGASDAAATAAKTATHAASGAVREAGTAGSSMMKWLIPLALVALALFFLPKMCRKVADTAGDLKDKATDVVAATGDSTKIISDASSLIKDAGTSIASIKDEASASAALPQLRDITTKLGGLSAMVAKLPGPLQQTVGTALRPLIAKLREAVQPVLAMPLVGAQVKPVVDEMLGQLDKLVPAP